MTKPYFYIIRHIPSQKKYAGCRWANDCNPEELLKKNGYLTSSRYIHQMIEKDGIESFEVIEIIEMDNPLEYETSFLIENDCAKSKEWLNRHNNNKRPAFGSKDFKQFMLKTHGVEHNTQIPEVKLKMIEKTKEFYKNNPELAKIRAYKVAESKKTNGTTGKGISKKHTNNGNTGKWIRTEEVRKKLSDNLKKRYEEGASNPMDNVESRAKVSASKVGRKRIYREDGTFYMPKVNSDA
jgi:hypothetical protein